MVSYGVKHVLASNAKLWAAIFLFLWTKISLDSDYDTDCSEENFLGEEELSPELANINLLSSKLQNKTKLIAVLETKELETL